jgi:hypothetical protein
MSELGSNVSESVVKMLSQERSLADIEAELRIRGFEEVQIHNMIKEAKKLLDAQKRTVGIGLVLTGAAICATSCIVTLLVGNEAISGITLIGATTCGIIVVFIGLVKIF